MNFLALNMLRFDLDSKSQHGPQQAATNATVADQQGWLTKLSRLISLSLDVVAGFGLIFKEWSNHLKLLDCVTQN